MAVYLKRPYFNTAFKAKYDLTSQTSLGRHQNWLFMGLQIVKLYSLKGQMHTGRPKCIFYIKQNRTLDLHTTGSYT